jgi:hypothetical protein
VKRRRWGFAEAERCAVCGFHGDGLRLKLTGAVLCFECHGSALGIIERALRSKGKRDKALN